MRKPCLIFSYLLSVVFTHAQPFASWTKNELRLTNGVVERTIQLPQSKAGFVTTVYKPINGNFNYFLNASTDFQFEISRKVYSGRSK